MQGKLLRPAGTATGGVQTGLRPVVHCDDPGQNYMSWNDL